MNPTVKRQKQVDIINGLASPPPSNLRDASGSNNIKQWTQKATHIHVPSNERIASGPFGASRTQSTLRDRTKQQQHDTSIDYGNPVASRTLAKPSAAEDRKIKRRKLNHSIGGGGVKLAPDTEPDSNPIKMKDSTIVISSDEEDLGKKVERPKFSDFNVRQFHIQGAASQQNDGLKLHRPPSLPGPSSQKLRTRIDSTTNEVEEISSFSDEPITGNALNGRRKGNVQGKIDLFENKIPMLNLYDLNKRNGLKKDGMKTKDSMKGKSRIPPTKNAAQVNLNANNRSKSNNNRAKHIVRLPLLEAYVGTQHYGESTLLWNADDGTMKVEHRTLPKRDREVDVKDCIHLKYSTGDSGLPIFVLTWGGSELEVERQLCFKISSRDRNCSTDDFDSFFEWLKQQIPQRSVVRNSKTLWESMTNQRADIETGEASAQAGPSSRRTVQKPDMSKPLGPDPDEQPEGPEFNAKIDEWKRNSGSRARQSNEGASTSTSGAPTRRSQRQSAEHNRAVQQAIQKQPIEKADEIILVYPWGTPGAVNLNRGDIGRLGPGEFLNDNLIEFGLKLWLTKLEKERPDLFKEVYVFSSFFYGKLKTKKGEEMEGYQQVRRWTSKVDIFQKKYLFVPINENYHWYLAIICNPQHVLLPPPEHHSPSTRAKQRQAAADEQPPSEEALSLVQDTPLEQETTTGNTEHSPIALSSDAQEVLEVDGLVRMSQEMGLDSRPSTPPHNSSTDVAMGSSPLTPTPAYMLDDVDMEARSETPDEDMHLAPAQESSPIVSDMATGPSKRRRPRPRPGRVPDSDEEDAEPPKRITGEASTSAASSSIPPAQFYGASGKARKRKSDVLEDSDIEVVGEVENASSRFKKGGKGKEKETEQAGPRIPPAPVNERPTTTILTLDSLGSPHPKAINILAAYLCMEAQDKLQQPNTSKAVGKLAAVPVQPNFCDCGLYLIHFVETFMTDPDHYFDVSYARKLSQDVKQKEWKANLIPNMREDLKAQATELSSGWRTWKEQKEQKEAEEKEKDKDKMKDDVTVAGSSDSEVDIVETVLAPASKGKGKGRAGKGKAKS